MAYDQYIFDLEQNCLNEDVCYDFESGGSQNCIECMSDENNLYIQELLSVFQDYQLCLSSQVSNSDNYASSILKLSAKNQLQLIETQEQIINNNTTQQLSGKFTLYDTNQSGQILPATSLITEIRHPQNPTETFINSQGELVYQGYMTKVNYINYDNHGNITEYQKIDNIHITYLWGYNYSFPIAKIENAKFDDVEPLLGGTYEQLQQKITDIELFPILNKLHTELPDAFVTTYTYDPLVGMTSETSPDGKITTYHYDDFNRLETIRDHNGNVVKHFEYHYQE